MKKMLRNVATGRGDGRDVAVKAGKVAIFAAAGAATLLLANLLPGVAHAAWGVGMVQLKKALFD